MPKDSHRLDLNADLEKLSGDFLKDVEAATKEVKQRKQADADKDRRNAVRKKDKRTSMIIIAAATIVLVFVAYWVVSARQPDIHPISVAVPQRNNPPIAMSRSATTQRSVTAPRLAPPPPVGNNRQTQRPPNEYEAEPM